MVNSELIFKNSKGIVMKQGTEVCQGILYCGKKFASNHGCKCGTCDGYCGIHNGCACPDCEYTLSYILYCTGKMKCGKCNNDLIRLNLKNIQLITGRYSAFICDTCNGRYYQKYIPIMHCFKCNFDLCPKCAFSNISKYHLNNLRITSSLQSISDGVLYCGNRYTTCGKCICGTCDGRCGPTNGCPCPKCDIILGYNIYLQKSLTCIRCGNGKILTKYILKGIQSENKGYLSGFICNICRNLYINGYNISYHCNKCSYDVCSKCALGNININNLKLPNLPLLPSFERNSTEKNLNKISDFNKEEKIRETEKTNDEMICVICYERSKCYLFLPCKHIACCENCGKMVNKCPLCRERIDSSFKVFI
ncbi:hypothetical protein H8356DRAFT_1750396 [Neocallimastix lanati (nom. inval.)]|nr:hypothetical protein H8356DRAFT_1750396 [Neocallimastix sp. JGI-2020a]